jgi:hypothetical protein
MSKNGDYMKNFKKTISFLDAENHRATINLGITNRNGYPEFTASGDYCGSGGQCLDEIKPKTHEQQMIIDLWKEYHLTDMSKLPDNVKFWPDFEGHLDGILEEIEKQETEREKEEAKIEKTENEKLLKQMEEYGIIDDNLDACRAYLDAMNLDDLKDFEESYQGQYSDDEEFAKEQAESMGAIDEKAQWPNSCIDWEKASQELMWDYTEQDGFYFRNL